MNLRHALRRFPWDMAGYFALYVVVVVGLTAALTLAMR